MSENFSIVKADKNLFSVYQTIYSNADTNMQFNWLNRLEDTLWTDNCFWVLDGDKKIGGILILEDKTRFAFLVSPFNDRELFWKIIHHHLKENNKQINKMCSVHDCDLDLLLSFGYKIDFTRKIMCRPTDIFTNTLNGQFYSCIPSLEKNLTEMIDVVEKGYKSGIDYNVFGAQSQSEIGEDIIRYIELYKKTGTINQSIIIFEKQSDRLIAICIAGKAREQSSWISGIADITVLPEYRNRGIGEFMIKNALTEAFKTSQIMELCVTVGNTAEILYRKTGFISGPRFSDMSLRII